MTGSVVRNERADEVGRLFGEHDDEWLPCTAAELASNCWVAVVAADGPQRGRVVSAITYLRGTALEHCCITGICTHRAYRRRGFARRLLHELLRTRPGAGLFVDLPLSRGDAVGFFRRYHFDSMPGGFACPGGSVHMFMIDALLSRNSTTS